MAEYDNTNTFALFPVKEKKNPKGPDFDGPGDCQGRKIRVAAWRRTSKAGNAFLSCKIEFEDERPAAQEQPQDAGRYVAKPTTPATAPVTTQVDDLGIPF